MPLRQSTILTTTVMLFAMLMSLGAGPAAAAGGGPDAAVWPLAPRPEVVAGFDPPDINWDAGHRGVDLRGAPGQSVSAAQPGEITYAGRLAGRGVVVVSHGDTRTTYQPVVASVHVGQHVVAGQKVGALQTFGSHCWPDTCLHWGLIRGETYLNPLTLVGSGPVRLLPLFAVLAALGLGSATPGPVAGSVATPWVRLPMPGDVLAGRPAAVGPR